MRLPIPIVVVVFMSAVLPVAAGACGFVPDAPDCPCFDATGDWDPAGATIQDCANDTMGTRESCSISNGGKPYYQMVLGSTSEAQALVIASVISMLGPLGFSPFHEREAWCSETISYWHREAGIPYPGGYYSWWHPTWQNYNVSAMKAWYEMEEGLEIFPIKGRGRWIKSTEIDYEDLVLGVSVPVPGAYVAIREYQVSPPAWLSMDSSHSLMIDEMWIHRDAVGAVFRIEVTLLQGNSSNPGQVKGGLWDDLRDRTPLGAVLIPNNRKIYGFGVDLTAAGLPLYDASRLHWVDHTFQATPNPPLQPTTIADRDWEGRFAATMPLLAAYAERAARSGGPQVASSSPLVPVAGLPDGRGVRWEFPSPLREAVEITIDLLDVHPIPIRGVELSWSASFVPAGYGVEFAGGDGAYRRARFPDLSNLVLPDVPGAALVVPVPVWFVEGSEGTEVRYVRLTFPEGTFSRRAAELVGLQFAFDWGPWNDAAENPLDGVFRRGYVNPGDSLDIADAICLLSYLFGAAADPCKLRVRQCLDAADANDDGDVNIGDAIALLSHLFARAGPLPAPFAACGYDPTYDALGCVEFAGCR